MKARLKKRLNIAAKIVAVLYIILITMLALDESLVSVAFLIHILPTAIFIGCLIVAWFRSDIGAILFLLAGVGTIIVFNTYKEFIPFVGISLIPIVVGVLFWLSKRK